LIRGSTTFNHERGRHGRIVNESRSLSFGIARL
jgi:hypothetical protein